MRSDYFCGYLFTYLFGASNIVSWEQSRSSRSFSFYKCLLNSKLILKAEMIKGKLNVREKVRKDEVNVTNRQN